MNQFSQDFKREANVLCGSILSCPPNRTHTILVAGLKRIRRLIAEACGTIDANATEDLESFKEAVHRTYHSIAAPFAMSNVYEIPFRIYYGMLETTEECSRLTGYHFDKGFEYANLSTAEVGLGNLDQGFSHMELAKAEDDRIGHKKGVAKTNLQYILDNAYAWAQLMIGESLISHPEKVSVLCEAKLEWTEKCRLAKAMWKFQLRIKDSRSSLNNDELERNLVNICKVVENYLRRKTPMPNVEPRRQALARLIDHAFDKSDWFDEWRSFRENQGLDYSDPVSDDEKLVSLLVDNSRRHETNVFCVLCIIRNFGAHVFNDGSALFSEKEYKKAFSMCIEALVYTLSRI
jgi:hypothetical protein